MGDLPAFMERLRETDAGEMTKLAFEFLILTAARTGEVVEATWAEINEDAKVWTVPADRMKAKTAHRVPLTERCLEILTQVRLLGCGSAYVFSGRSPAKPLSNMAFLMLLRRMERAITAHAFRSIFSDWAAERTGHPREVVEMALAHTIRNKVEAAYRRGDLFDKRRRLMEDWERHVTRQAATVVTLPVVRD